MKTTPVVVGAVAAWCATVSAPTAAHHSVAMFDEGKQITLQGTVKEFQYTNPHSWLQILVTGDDGKTVEWDFESEGPSSLLRKGIKASTFSPGDKVTVVAHPMKDGRTAGTLLFATAADGHAYAL
jgi:Family of unknown function (DUF6152)